MLMLLRAQRLETIGASWCIMAWITQRRLKKRNWTGGEVLLEAFTSAVKYCVHKRNVTVWYGAYILFISLIFLPLFYSRSLSLSTFIWGFRLFLNSIWMQLIYIYDFTFMNFIWVSWCSIQVWLRPCATEVRWQYQHQGTCSESAEPLQGGAQAIAPSLELQGVSMQFLQGQRRNSNPNSNALERSDNMIALLYCGDLWRIMQ